MRVLFYVSSAWWNGSTRAVAVLARGLAERGHSVTVACEPEGAVEQRLEFGAYEVLPIPTGGPWPAAALRLRRELLDRFVQVVVVHGARDQLAASAAANLAGRAAVLRRLPPGAPATLGPGSRTALKLAPGGFVASAPEELRRVPRHERVRLESTVAPLGVDVHAYESVRPATSLSLSGASGGHLIVCAYDGASRGPAATVLRTLALLAPHHPELRAVFVGPGSDDAELQMHAAALRITRRVTFLGDRDDRLAVLAAGDLGWVVSRGDDAAFAYLDFMALRIPVLAQRDGIAPLYVPDGITGLLLAPNDAPDAAAAIARALANDDRRAVMGSAGHARVARDFTDTAMLDAFERAIVAAGESGPS